MSTTLTDQQLIDMRAWVKDRKNVPLQLVYNRLAIVLDALIVTRSALQEASDTGLTLMEDRALLQQEVAGLRHLRDELADYEDDRRRVLSDTGAHDEVHCSCVPFLRAELDQLRLQLSLKE